MKKGLRLGVRAMPVLVSAMLGLAFPPAVFARQAGGSVPQSGNRLRPLGPGEWTRIADPKLDGGLVHITYFLEPTASRYDVTITVLSGTTKVVTLFQG